MISTPMTSESPLDDPASCPVCGLELGAGISVCPNDGTRLEYAREIGDTLDNKYEFVERIAQGGMGIVFKARQAGLNRLVAVKMLSSPYVSDLAMRRFQNEAQAMANLSHPNLVALHELSVTRFGQPYMVMEYVDGISLDRVLRTQRLPFGRAMKIVAKICDGLAYVHANGVLHRDLKPSNIMLMEQSEAGEPNVKLFDFGIAKVLDSNATTLTRTGEVFGSPLYMSPEQARGMPVDQRSDIYSLGCVVYELLSGQPPFPGASAVDVILKHVSQTARPLNYVNPRIPQRVAALVGKMLEKDPADRYQTIEEIRCELASLPKEQRIPQLNMPAISTGHGARLALMVLAVSVLSLAAYVILSVVCDKPQPLAHVSQNMETALSVARGLEGRRKHAPGNDRSADTADDFDISGFEHQVMTVNNIDAGGFGPIDSSAFKAIAKRTNRDVEAIKVPYTKVDDTVMGYIGNLPLRILHVEHSCMTRKSVPAIVRLTTLEELGVSGVGLTDSDVAELMKLRGLNVLYAQNCGLDDAALMSLAKHGGFARLYLGDEPVYGKVHTISNRNITDQGVSFLSRVGKQITALDLSGTRVTDKSAAVLARSMPNLKEVRLARTQLTDAGLAGLARLELLDRLDLSSTQITDRGLACLKKPGLVVGLDQCPRVTPLGRELLRRNCPNCTIE